MRRVVVTGMGVVSCLGNDLDTVSRSLRESQTPKPSGKPEIRHSSPTWLSAKVWEVIDVPGCSWSRPWASMRPATCTSTVT